jgi:septal ring factor EnvC (AmiA/AmiB activator)
MNTFTKELKQMIGITSGLIACAFVALVALFATAGGLDKLGTSVLLAVLVAFVAVGSAVIVDEYHAEQRRQIARAHWYELDAVRYMRDEYADTLSMVEADARDDRDNTKRLSAEVQELRVKNDELASKCVSYQIQRNRAVNKVDEMERTIEELEEQLSDTRLVLNELRHAVRAERERIADI